MQYTNTNCGCIIASKYAILVKVSDANTVQGRYRIIFESLWKRFWKRFLETRRAQGLSQPVGEGDQNKN